MGPMAYGVLMLVMRLSKSDAVSVKIQFPFSSFWPLVRATAFRKVESPTSMILPLTAFGSSVIGGVSRPALCA